MLARAPRVADRQGGWPGAESPPHLRGPAPPAHPSPASGLQDGRGWKYAAGAAACWDRSRVAVGSSPRTIQAHPTGPTPRLLRAWALPGPRRHCRTLAGGQQGCQWKCLPRFQTGLPPGQPLSNSPLPSSSPVLNGILDNQSVRPSAQLGKCSSVEGDVTDGARLPPGSGEAAPPPSSPASHSSLIVMGTGVPRAKKLGRGSATWLEDGFRPFLLLGQLHRWGRIDAYQPPGGRSHLVFRRRSSGRRWDPAGNLPVQEAVPPHLRGGAGTRRQPRIPRFEGGGLHWFCLFCGSGRMSLEITPL